MGRARAATAEANGGIAKSGDAKVVNVAIVKQDSEQEMKVWDNDKWSSWSFEQEEAAPATSEMREGTDRPR